MTPTDLKTLRTSLGWTQKQLAKELGVFRNTVTRWELGQRKISRFTALAIRSVLKKRRP